MSLYILSFTLLCIHSAYIWSHIVLPDFQDTKNNYGMCLPRENKILSGFLCSSHVLTQAFNLCVCSVLPKNCAKQLIVLKHKILVLSEMESDWETNCKLIEKISWRWGPVILGVEHFGEREDCLHLLNSELLFSEWQLLYLICHLHGHFLISVSGSLVFQSKILLLGQWLMWVIFAG